MRVSAAGKERAMFLRWWNADLVTCLMLKERLLSKRTPRLRQSGEGERVKLSIERWKSLAARVRELLTV